MDIFGLTPIDSALTVWGLNNAYALADFIFVRTPIGLLSFIIGLLFSIKPIIQAANFRPLFYLFFTYITVFLLLLNNREEGKFTSAMETYAHVSDSAQEMKKKWGNGHRVPVVLAFVEQSAGAIVFGMIQTLDQFIPDHNRFLKAAYIKQYNVLNIQKVVHQPIEDLGLKKILNNFLRDHYLPAAQEIMNENSLIELNNLGPGHDLILQRYSPEAKNTWVQLTKQLAAYYTKQFHFKNNAIVYLEQMTGQSIKILEDHLIHSLSIYNLNQNTYKSQSFRRWQISFWVMNAYPFILGSINAIVLALFPVVILFVLIFQRIHVLASYLKLYLWSKFNILSCALAYYLSAIYGQIHMRINSNVSYIWEYPVFCVIAAGALFLLPILSGIFLKQMSVLKY